MDGDRARQLSAATHQGGLLAGTRAPSYYVVTRDYNTMRTIGIRDLKAQLSRALRDVQRGELYLVTDRGRVVAELRPPSTADHAALSPVEIGRRKLSSSGELRVSEADGIPYQVSGISLPEGATRELLNWVRGSE